MLSRVMQCDIVNVYYLKCDLDSSRVNCITFDVLFFFVIHQKTNLIVTELSLILYLL